MKDIFQLELWSECTEYRCKFCSLHFEENSVCNYTSRDKIGILQSSLGYLPKIDWSKYDRVLFRGGEILNFQPSGVRKEFIKLIKALEPLIGSGAISTIILVTSLKYMYEGSLLEQVVDRLIELGYIDNLLIGTSYDLKYRFTSEIESRWWDTVHMLIGKGVHVHCTSILTQYLAEAYMNNDSRLTRVHETFGDSYNLLAAWVKGKNSVPEDFLIKRKTFLKFCIWLAQNEPKLWSRFVDQSDRRSSAIYFAEYDSVTYRDTKTYKHIPSPDTDDSAARLSFIPGCNHLISNGVYADSDRCFTCDFLELIQSGGM